MPYVNVKLAGELTNEQRARLAKGITDVIVEVTDKPPSAVLVCVEALPRNHWAKAGELLGS